MIQPGIVKNEQDQDGLIDYGCAENIATLQKYSKELWYQLQYDQYSKYRICKIS